MTASYALEVRQITKRFPGVLANDRVDFTLRHGEIHALLGENGAGKSTLMNIIYGLYRPDEGEILVEDRPIQLGSTNDAIGHGIGMVHQHFMLVPVFTVAENITLGAEVVRGPTLDMAEAGRRIRQLSKEFGLQVDPEAIVEELPVGLQQRVEIVKALYRRANILVLDEPTAVLTPQEADELFVVMRQLTKRGVSIIFITHKLKEVLKVADRYTVMRRGQVVGVGDVRDMDEAGLAALMVGRDVLFEVKKTPAQPGDVVLVVQDLTVRDDRNVDTVEGVSFEVRAGEILGVAGVQGNGQTELIEAITGLRTPHSGAILLGGQAVHPGDPRFMFEHGMAHVPEDRHKHGLVLPYSIADNMVLNMYYKPPFARGMQRLGAAVVQNARTLIEKFDVRTPSEAVAAGNLSGGNQQKVIVARELSRQVRLLVVNQPTRGLDVGSIEFIHAQIIAERDKGAAVLLVSAELDEILNLADRVAVMFDGHIVGVLSHAEATRERLGLLMTGGTQHGAPA